MSYDEFWRIADTFRDERFWKIRDNKLYKFNIWGEESDYGEVFLNKKHQEKYKNYIITNIKINYVFRLQ